MKKIILPVLFIIAFSGYAIYLKINGEKLNPLPIPNNNQGMDMMGQNNQMMALYKDGSYTGDSVDAYYGNVQVEAVIKNGLITDIQFLDYPKDRSTSLRISNMAMPVLQTETIRAQSANVNIVSGATQTSEGFIRSLSSALALAKN